jgi:hypothetical protein
VLSIVSVVGIHAATTAAPILAELVEARSANGTAPAPAPASGAGR